MGIDNNNIEKNYNYFLENINSKFIRLVFKIGISILFTSIILMFSSIFAIKTYNYFKRINNPDIINNLDNYDYEKNKQLKEEDHLLKLSKIDSFRFANKLPLFNPYNNEIIYTNIEDQQRVNEIIEIHEFQLAKIDSFRLKNNIYFDKPKKTQDEFIGIGGLLYDFSNNLPAIVLLITLFYFISGFKKFSEIENLIIVIAGGLILSGTSIIFKNVITTDPSIVNFKFEILGLNITSQSIGGIIVIFGGTLAIIPLLTKTKHK